VGASGDLAPMSQIALLMLGEGQAYYQDELLPGAEAMDRAGIPVPGLEARDGLATINGSNVLTAMSAIHIHDMERWLKQAEIAAAMSLEALLANMKPYEAPLHEVRGFAGSIRSAPPSASSSPARDLLTARSRPGSRTPTACARRPRSSAPPATRSHTPAARSRSN
jgi:histidine ammonia-lyase